jgi:hypothetical protein
LSCISSSRLSVGNMLHWASRVVGKTEVIITCHHGMWFNNCNSAVTESCTHSKLPIHEEETHFLRVPELLGLATREKDTLATV